MNVTEYIESGILESYIMGTVSDQEQREVQCLSSIYPEIKQELDQLADTFEQYALSYSVEPPASVKDKLLQQLEFESAPIQTVVRPMPVDTPATRTYTYRTTWVVAASVGLLLLLFSFFLLSRLRTSEQSLASLQKTNSTMQAEVRQLKDRQGLVNQTLAMLHQPGTRMLELRGNDKAPTGDMFVFWNARTRQVAIDVRSLPALPPDKQYQLWSLVDGKPVDAGVFDATTGTAGMQHLNRPIDKADAFAVTIEKRGGSPSPTLSTLLAMTTVDA
jgi:anti-sigma-K factor RskA